MPAAMIEKESQTEETRVPERLEYSADKPLVGTWIDESHSWYDGSAIEILDGGKWSPIRPKQQVHQEARYESKIVSDREWELIERRRDNSTRRFKVIADEAGESLEVQFIYANGSPGALKWHLVRNTLGKQRQRKNIVDFKQARLRSDSRALDLEWTWGWSALQGNARIVVAQPAFEYVVGLVILIGTALIGYQIEQAIQSLQSGLQTGATAVWLEAVVVVFYICELAVRIVAKGRGYLKDRLGLLDLCTVLCGTIAIFFRNEPGWLRGTFGNRIMIIRIFRLFRVVKPIRKIAFLQPLWKLISGLQHSLGTLMSTFMVVFFVLYIFACVGGEVITQNPPLRKLMECHDKNWIGEGCFDKEMPCLDCCLDCDDADDAEKEVGKVVSEKFSSLPTIMLTLVQFTTADITPVYYPLATERPWLAIYFGTAYLIITILLMNLFTAVLVEAAITRSSEDREMKSRKARKDLDHYIPQLEMVFEKVDRDHSGDFSLHELAKWRPDEHLQLDDKVREVLLPATLEVCYECFDADNSGTVSKDEFVNGALAVLLNDAPHELTQLLQLVRSSNKQLNGIQERLNTLEVKRLPEESSSG